MFFFVECINSCKLKIKLGLFLCKSPFVNKQIFVVYYFQTFLPHFYHICWVFLLFFLSFFLWGVLIGKGISNMNVFFIMKLLLFSKKIQNYKKAHVTSIPPKNQQSGFWLVSRCICTCPALLDTCPALLDTVVVSEMMALATAMAGKSAIYLNIAAVNSHSQ